jgi:hypothetical protein
MTPQLVFAPRGLGSETAKIGADVVGEIIPLDGNRVAWMTCPGKRERRHGPAHTREAARRMILREVEDWLCSLGWISPGDKIDITIVEKEMA